MKYQLILKWNTYQLSFIFYTIVTMENNEEKKTFWNEVEEIDVEKKEMSEFRNKVDMNKLKKNIDKKNKILSMRTNRNVPNRQR